jgi:hypothetical protein
MKVLSAIACAVLALGLAAGPSAAQQKKKPPSCESVCKTKMGSDNRKFSNCMTNCARNRSGGK